MPKRGGLGGSVGGTGAIPLLPGFETPGAWWVQDVAATTPAIALLSALLSSDASGSSSSRTGTRTSLGSSRIWKANDEDEDEDEEKDEDEDDYDSGKRPALAESARPRLHVDRFHRPSELHVIDSNAHPSLKVPVEDGAGALPKGRVAGPTDGGAPMEAHASEAAPGRRRCRGARQACIVHLAAHPACVARRSSNSPPPSVRV